MVNLLQITVMLDQFIKPFLIAAVAATCLFVLTWFVARRLNNFGIVDIVWSYGFSPAVIFFAASTHGDLTHRCLITAMTGLWSLRLGTHILIRVRHHHPHEDIRYARLRLDWGDNLPVKSFVFFLLQAVILVLLSSLFLIVCLNAKTGITRLEWSGILLWIIALAGESLADYQLKRFKASPVNRAQVCQTGLWYYSRHPNYFFEWLIWVAFFLFAWDSPGGCYAVLCPGLMLFFLLRVTGIPLTEELSVKNKGDAYRQYQQTTSAFVPWFKKSGPGSTPAKL